MITLEQAKQLSYHQVIYYNLRHNSDGSPMRYRVNGAPKTWKKRPDRVSVPLKRGLYEYGYLTEENMSHFCLTESEARQG